MIEQLKIDFNKIEENSKFSEDNIKFRKKNLQHFVEKGFPNKRIEDWKFSDLNQIISSNISNLSFFNDKEFKDSEQIYLIDKFEHNKIIFINGAISKIDIKHEDGKKIIINNDLDFIGNSNEVNPLVSLNNALANTYTCVTVKENYSLNKPLIIYTITTEELQSTALNLRIDIKLERNSNLKLVTIFDDNSQQNFININQNFNIAQDAILKSYKIDHKANSNIKYF